MKEDLPTSSQKTPVDREALPSAVGSNMLHEFVSDF